MDGMDPPPIDKSSKSLLRVTIDTLRATCRSQRIDIFTEGSQKGAHEFISSTLRACKDKKVLRKDDLADKEWDQLCHVFMHDERKIEIGASTVVLPVWREDRLIGLLVAEDSVKDGDKAPIDDQLLSFVPLIVEALKQEHPDQQERLYQKFQADTIKLSRFAEGDLPRMELDRMQGTEHPIGSSLTFALGARMICDLFHKQAHTCMIFDATSIRYVPSDEASTTISDSTTSYGVDGHAAYIPESDHVSSARSRLLRGESETITGQAMNYVASTEGMGGETLQSYLTANSTAIPSSGSRDDVGDEICVEVPVFGSVAPRSVSNTEHSQGDEVLGATSGKVLCSYARSPLPVPLLAFCSDGRMEADVMASLEGDKVRRTMAGYFASARQSEHGAQIFLEWGDNELSDLRVRKLIGRNEKEGGIMCAASVDAGLQPSFWMLILFEHTPIFSRRETLLVEQVGIILSHSLLRKRARAVDFAQQLFMQKVQHELRTPLHAIIGVNETVSFAVKAAQSDLHGVRRNSQGKDRNVQRKGNDDIRKTLIELGDLSSSIAGSADRLSALIDDLVDFSLLQQGSNRKKKFALNASGMSSPRCNANDEASPSIADSILVSDNANEGVTIATLLSVLSTTVERCFLLFRRSVAVDDAVETKLSPPEMIMSMDEMSDLDPTQTRLTIDLDCLRRVLWKLVSNAIQYTEEGLVSISIKLKSIGVKANVGLLPGQPSKSLARTAYRLQFCINDSGIGMSSDFLNERIFHAYQQEDSDSVGLGLSLTLCRYLVDQMEGWIRAESQEGQGSTFTFSVPAHVVSKVKAEASVPHSDDPLTNRGPLVVHLAFLGFQKRKSLAMLQKAVVPHLCGVQVEESQEKLLDSVDTTDVIVIAVEFWDDEGASDGLARAISSCEELPILIISTAKNLRHKYSSALWEQIEQVYNDRGASSNIFTLERPWLTTQLERLQEICEEARFRRICRNGSDKGVGGLGEGLVAGMMMQSQRAADTLSVSSLTSHSHTESTSASAVDMTKSQTSNFDGRMSFKVLVVEDNPLNARILTSLLSRADIPYLMAMDGVEAVEIFRKELPAVVLLDINMPRMNGFEAAKLMRAFNSPFKHYIVAITALSAERDRVQGLDAGMDDWLTKPVRLGPLITDLQERRRTFAH